MIVKRLLFLLIGAVFIGCATFCCYQGRKSLCRLFINNSREVRYYAIDEAKTYFAIDSKCVYITNSPGLLSEREQWGTRIELNKTRRASLYISPSRPTTVIAVHKEPKMKGISRRHWLIWTPYAVDNKEMIHLTIKGLSLESYNSCVRRMTPEEIMESPVKWPPILGQTATKEIIDILNRIDTTTSSLQIKVVSVGWYEKKSIFKRR